MYYLYIYIYTQKKTDEVEVSFGKIAFVVKLVGTSCSFVPLPGVVVLFWAGDSVANSRQRHLAFQRRLGAPAVCMHPQERGAVRTVLGARLTR